MSVTFVHCAQTAEDIDTVSLAYIGQPLSPQILRQTDPPPVDLSVGDIRRQIAAEWLEIAQWSQWRAYRKPPSFFRMVLSLTPAIPLPPKWGFQIYPYEQCRLLPNNFRPCFK